MTSIDEPVEEQNIKLKAVANERHSVQKLADSILANLQC